MRLTRHNINFTIQDASAATLADTLREKIVNYLTGIGFVKDSDRGDYTFLKYKNYENPKLQLLVAGTGTNTATNKTIAINFTAADVNSNGTIKTTSVSSSYRYTISVGATYTVDYTLTVLQSNTFLGILGDPNFSIKGNRIIFRTLKNTNTEDTQNVFVGTKGVNFYEANTESNTAVQYYTNNTLNTLGYACYPYTDAVFKNDRIVLIPAFLSDEITITGSSSTSRSHPNLGDWYFDEMFIVISNSKTTFTIGQKYRINNKTYFAITSWALVEITAT